MSFSHFAIQPGNGLTCNNDYLEVSFHFTHMLKKKFPVSVLLSYVCDMLDIFEFSILQNQKVQSDLCIFGNVIYLFVC